MARSKVRKSGAVIEPTVASVSAITLADRGWPSIADSSPKLCPGCSSRNATSRPASEKMVTFSFPAQDEEQVVRIVLVADHGLAGPELPDPDVPLDFAPSSS